MSTVVSASPLFCTTLSVSTALSRPKLIPYLAILTTTLCLLPVSLHCNVDLRTNMITPLLIPIDNGLLLHTLHYLSQFDQFVTWTTGNNSVEKQRRSPNLNLINPNPVPCNSC